MAVAMGGESVPTTETDSPTLSDAGLTESDIELAALAFSIVRLTVAYCATPPPSPFLVS
jgi:hypothetical protein